uniref:Anti-proliferative protein domain-containing protein n=1 Tax=Wuchereria bancrofti TaxID=6293 RepID=A0AAF5PQK1_WUCBA
MYTELKELINFLAIYMHHRIPRRRICLFMESYSNHLVGRFLGKWKPEEPEYGEKERTLVIKTGDCLDQIVSTIATSIGIVEEDLAACFPSPMIAYCNPGVVSCQMMNYAHMITVWMGDVNADVNFTPVPDGIAFFCETPAILYNVLNSNGNVMDKTKYPFCFVPKNKELKSQRCILLQLISSMDDYAYDLVWSGFIFENEIPPLLFRYTTKENCPFTARLFADTRFGCHRSRPDHKAMRRIQHAAAYLAVTNDSAGYNSASGSHQESVQYDINSSSNNSIHHNAVHDIWHCKSFHLKNFTPVINITMSSKNCPQLVDDSTENARHFLIPTHLSMSLPMYARIVYLFFHAYNEYFQIYVNEKDLSLCCVLFQMNFLLPYNGTFSAVHSTSGKQSDKFWKVIMNLNYQFHFSFKLNNLYSMQK